MKSLRVGAVSRNYFNLPLWLGIEAGFFSSEGLSPEIHLIEAIDQVTEGLASGALDLALNVTENTLLNRESGGDLTIIGGNVNRLPFSLIARPGIHTVADLRGAKIGVSSLRAGSSSLVMLCSPMPVCTTRPTTRWLQSVRFFRDGSGCARAKSTRDYRARP